MKGACTCAEGKERASEQEGAMEAHYARLKRPLPCLAAPNGARPARRSSKSTCMRCVGVCGCACPRRRGVPSREREHEHDAGAGCLQQTMPSCPEAQARPATIWHLARGCRHVARRAAPRYANARSCTSTVRTTRRRSCRVWVGGCGEWSGRSVLHAAYCCMLHAAPTAS